MSTKLVVSVDGLLLTNLDTVVSSRSIGEVVLVSTASDFNALTTSQLNSISTAKTNGIGSATLSIALANESTASLDNEFFNFLQSNNISFFNDPGLQSLSSGLILTSNGSETLTSISGTSSDNFNSKIADFNTSSISSNSLYKAGSSLALGSNLGTKPTISVSSPSFLDDLQGSIVVTISASDFSSYLSSESDVISLADPSNLTVQSSTQTHSAVNQQYLIVKKADLSAGYNGSNRLDGVLVQNTVGSTSKNNYWGDASDIEVTVSEALMIPTMGVAPHSNLGSVTLKDTAEKLSAGLMAFTDGQLASFNNIVISDNNVLVLDPATFKALDTASQSASWSSHNGTSISRADNTTSVIKLVGTAAEFTSSGLWDGTNLSTSLSSDAQNMVALATQLSIDGTISSASELSGYTTFLSAASDASKTVTTNLNFASSFGSTGLTAAQFISLADLDNGTSQALISDNFPSGLTISDTADNIKSLITNTTSSVIAAKAYIGSITSTSDANEKIQLSWEEYIGAISGTSFDSTNSSTWSTSSIAFHDIGNIELVVTGTASEIYSIVDKYGSSLTNFPAGLTFKILDGAALTLTQAQLDKLDARIDGVVTVSDTSTGIGTLLDNAIPTSVQQISSTNTLAITFDQFRNLPNYYSGDVVIRDTEDNIVGALNEDLLDDRVTTLVITDQSTTLGKATTSGGSTSTADSAITVTASAAKNILVRRFTLLQITMLTLLQA